jgi:proline iminopeptidase
MRYVDEVRSDGCTIAVVEFGGPDAQLDDAPAAPARPPLLLVHPTGLCAGTWTELAASFTRHRRVVGFDLRGHGASSKPPDPAAYAWEHFATDCLAVLDRLDCGPVDAIGHSCGAATLVLAASRAPDPFGRLVLVEPIVPPPVPPETAASGTNPMAEGARRRRMEFASRGEMHARLAAKAPMATWRPAVLDAYVDHCSTATSEGTRVLCCPGEIEAAVYEHSTGHRGWDALCELTTPTLVACGGDGVPLPVRYWEAVTARIPDAHLDVLDGLGHFAPQQDPDAVAASARRFLDAAT